MGYYISQGATEFFIAKEHFPKALEAVKELSAGSYVDSTDKCATLPEALDAWRWQSLLDDDGNIHDITFSGEKLGEEPALFEVLAPFVKAGSYVTIHGEEECVWKHVFDGESVDEIASEVIFDDEPRHEGEFYTDFGQSLRLRSVGERKDLIIPRYAVWGDLGKDKMEVIETHEDLDALHRRYGALPLHVVELA